MVVYDHLPTSIIAYSHNHAMVFLCLCITAWLFMNIVLLILTLADKKIYLHFQSKPLMNLYIFANRS